MGQRYEHFSYNFVEIPKILMMGCSADIEETHYGPGRRRQYLIHYVISGKGYFNGQLVEKGHGFLITPGIYEYYYADEEEPWFYLWIICEDSAIEYFMEQHMADADSGIFQFQNIHTVESVAKKLMSNAEGIIFSSTELTEFFLKIFNNCVNVSARRDVSNEKMYVEFSINYINANLHFPITVEGLCKKLGVSQPYLYRIFQKRIGCSPKQYISECKLSQAKEMLEQTEFSVSEIAKAVGFGDVLSFSKFFSSKTMVSPTEYRKMKK